MSERASRTLQDGDFGVDRRGARRIRAIGRLARIADGRSQGACRLIDISDGGMKFETALDLEPGDALEVEVSPENVLPARVVWSNGSTHGARFVGGIDCCALLRRLAQAHWRKRELSREASGEPARLPGRFSPGLPITVKDFDGAELHGRLHMTGKGPPLVEVESR